MDKLKQIVGDIPPFYAFLINCGFAFLVMLTMLIMPAFKASIFGYSVGISGFRLFEASAFWGLIYTLMFLFVCVPVALSFIKRTIPEILVIIFAGVYFTFMLLIAAAEKGVGVGAGFYVNIFLFLPAWIIFAYLRKGKPVSFNANDKK